MPLQLKSKDPEANHEAIIAPGATWDMVIGAEFSIERAERGSILETIPFVGPGNVERAGGTTVVGPPLKTIETTLVTLRVVQRPV